MEKLLLLVITVSYYCSNWDLGRIPIISPFKAMVTKNAVIGIDLGADTSFVGYVGKALNWNGKVQNHGWCL